MTKEEAIKALKSNYPSSCYTMLREAVDTAIEALSRPSLPSNLDEAAEEYMQQVKATFLRTLEHPTAKDAFKAGAEWMAGQFVFVGGEPTGWFSANDGSEYATGLDLKEPIKLPVDFYVRKWKKI